MTHEQPLYEIEISIIILGLGYSASLISLIIWIA